MNKTAFASPLGLIEISEENAKITKIDFTDKLPDISETPVLKEAKRQLSEYFQKERRVFDFPLEPKGSDFEKKVWQELLKIPYGKSATYGEIAERVGSPRGARSVGHACHNNPIAIVIPCHRVLGKSGKLTGYASGLDKKAKLLELESEK